MIVDWFFLAHFPVLNSSMFSSLYRVFGKELGAFLRKKRKFSYKIFGKTYDQNLLKVFELLTVFSFIHPFGFNYRTLKLSAAASPGATAAATEKLPQVKRRRDALGRKSKSTGSGNSISRTATIPNSSCITDLRQWLFPRNAGTAT